MDFGYGLGSGAAKAILRETKAASGNLLRQQTEVQIRADEARNDEDAKRLDVLDAAAKKHGTG